MDGYRDTSPRILILFVGVLLLYLAVSEFTGLVGGLSAFVASVTGGMAGALLGTGVGLIDAVTRFFVGCVVAVSLLVPLLVVTGMFEE